MGGWGKAAHCGDMSVGKESCLGWAGQYMGFQSQRKRANHRQKEWKSSTFKDIEPGLSSATHREIYWTWQQYRLRVSTLSDV